jgi:WD40-like Beta Propeller Repeat
MTDRTLEERALRAEFRRVPMPPDLTVPPDLADAVLGELRPGPRRRGLLIAAAAAATAAAIAVPLALVGGRPDAPAPPAGGLPAVLRFPAFGGGPVTAWVWDLVDAHGTRTSYLLDPRTGTYHRMPYPVVLSPDTRYVAVSDGGHHVGWATRDEILSRGARAVRWLDEHPSLPGFDGFDGTAPRWSPDGTTLMWSRAAAQSGGTSLWVFTLALRDASTGGQRTTVSALYGNPGWDADSAHYLALVTPKQGDPAGLYRVPLDRRTPPVKGAAGTVGGAESYSPSRQYAYLDGSPLGGPHLVLVLPTGTAIPVPTGTDSTRWYDDTTLAQVGLDGVTLTDFHTGVSRVVRPVRRGPVPPGQVSVQTGPSAGLTGAAASLGF